MAAEEEKSFDATFPEDYRAEELQNKTLQFSVTVHEVSEAVTPNSMTSFKFGVTEGGESSFREEVKEYGSRARGGNKKSNKTASYGQLVEIHDFCCPTT